MNIELSININEYVECELTEHGKNEITKSFFKPEYTSGNFIKIQLWELMKELGDSMFNGADQCIVNNRITIIGETKF